MADAVETVDDAGDAVDVADRYERSVRNLVGYTISGLVAYSTIAALASLGSLWFRFAGSSGGERASGFQFAFTLKLGDGVTILGLLTTLVIALHVVAWQINPTGPLSNVVHARRRLLGDIAGPLGLVAIVTGAATVLHGIPDETGIGHIAAGFAAVAIAAFALDIEAAVESNRSIHQVVNDVSRKRDATAAGRVAARWATRRTTTNKGSVWDFAKLAMTAAAPVLMLILADIGSRPITEQLGNAGIAVLSGIGTAAAAVFIVFGSVLAFVTRSHFNFLMCILPGASWMLAWLVVAVAVGVSDASILVKIVLIAAFAWLVLSPAVLVAAGLFDCTHRLLPGASVRPYLHQTLTKRHERLIGVSTRNRSTEVATPGFAARLSLRYRLATGTEPDRIHIQTPSNAGGAAPEEGKQA